MSHPASFRLAAVFLSLAPITAQVDPGTSYRFRVTGPVSAAQRGALERTYGVHGHAVEDLQVIIAPDELTEFRRLGLRTRLIDRGRPFAEIAAERAARHDAPDPGYFTVAEIEQELASLQQTYPTIARRVDLTALPGAARTHDGRRIYGLKISDNVATDEDEPAVLLAAQHHARELNSPYMVIGAARRLLAGYASDPSIRRIINNAELYLVPMVNPDGVNWVWTQDNLWRKNRRSTYGVDLNRNYPFLWARCGSSTRTTSQVYRGPSAASEPETRTMMAVAKALRPEVYLDFHSSGREVLFTYAPCATVNGTMRNYLTGFQNDLRAPMRYAARNPSASGEAPEYHWAASGSMSFLTEISTSFQPAFTTTVAEEARVWPGIRRALTTWQPTLRGHVRSIFKNEGVDATISYTPSLFSEGEVAHSRERDGRFALWIPPGTWTVRFAAPGFSTITRRITVPASGSLPDLDLEMIPSQTPATITRAGTDRLGTTNRYTYTSPGSAGDVFWIAASTARTPGIAIGSRMIPLRVDGLLIESATPGFPFTGNLGTLDTNGRAIAALPIPNLPIFSGFQIYVGGITIDSDWAFDVEKFSSSIETRFR